MHDLYTSYNSLEILETADTIDDLIDLLNLIGKDKDWALYLTQYPLYDQENFKTFEEYRNPPRKKTAEEILADVRQITMSTVPKKKKKKGVK